MATGKPILDYDNRLSSMLWGEDVNADLNYLVSACVVYQDRGTLIVCICTSGLTYPFNTTTN